MKAVYDYAIVGAGCAGLSLAMALLPRLPADRRVLIIEPREDYHLDRIWCFWNTTPHPFKPAVRHEWRRWMVRHQGRQVIHASARYPYQYVPADAFYTQALALIEQFPAVEMLLGTRAEEIRPAHDAVCIATDRGVFKARLVFDGRNDPRRFVAQGYLLQHYAGQRIQSARPVFNPGTMTLMDFDVSQEHGIAFVYVLPFSKTEALVEPTIFSHTPCDPAVYDDILRRYVRERFGLEKYRVLFREQGIIPMTAERLTPRRPGRVVPIGTGAGMVKGSTGYGFLAIQHWSRVLAKAVAQDNGGRLPPPRRSLTRILDQIFLSFLETHPAAAPGVFYDLFQSVPADRLVRFLSDRALPVDVAAVVRAMPKAPFIRQAVKVMGIQ
jgi:lycopene beta-cyclase